MVADKLNEIRRRMHTAAVQSGRRTDTVTLVAVSKGQSTDAIMSAYDTGHRDFGENRAGELAAKAPVLPDDIVWHFIGSLQTRQAKLALPYTSLLHSMDRPRLVTAWSRGEATPPVLIQVNVAGEAQKHGVPPEDVPSLLEAVEENGIDCVGLMTIPPLVADGEDNRRWFAELRELRDGLSAGHPRLTELSMGMTDDFEVAIAEGATKIRVGRAIFGPPAAPARND